MMRWMPATPCCVLACLIVTLSPPAHATKRPVKHEPKSPSLVMPPPAPLAPPPTPPPVSPAPSAAPVPTIEADSHDVWATTHAMAQAVHEAYDRLHRTEAFHRLALPYLGDDSLHVNIHPMGRVVAEMLAAELAKDTPFVVLDRGHLSETMSQNHLSDLYRLDSPSAVAFGRLLGAQTLLTGMVEDGGDDKYLVHLRQLDMQTGRVLMDSQAVMARDALDTAAARVVIQRTMKDALWRSALFPGVGQWYLQERPKAYVLGGAGAATLGTAVGFYIAAAVARSAYLQNKPSTVGDRQVANDRLVGGNVSLALYGAVWLANMLDIYFTPPPPPQILINANE